MKRTSHTKHAKRLTSSPVEGSVPIRLQNRYSPIAPDDDDDDLCANPEEEEEFPMPKTRKRKRFLAAQKGIFFPIPWNIQKKELRKMKFCFEKLKLIVVQIF